MTTPAPTILDALTFPLRGSSLVEASAGTGKTYTISALFLRLVLNHGGTNAAFGRELDPSQILVVTFTEAATKELRDRIRRRLAEAAAAFQADPAAVGSQPTGDELLHALRADYPPAEWPACARRLQLAAESMDEAAVSTIHGWCNRMLREHAFDSGSLFSQTLQADTSELFDETVRDYWRTFVYPLGADDVASVTGWWEAPQQLGESVRNLVGLRSSLGAGEEPATALRSADHARQGALAASKAPWLKWPDDLLQKLEAGIAAKQVAAGKLPKRAAWLRDMKAWAEGAVTELPLTMDACKRLTPAGMAEVWLVPPVINHPALTDMLTLPERIAALPNARPDILCHAAHWISDRLALEKARRAEMDFDDMLTQLDAALLQSHGGRLAQSIRTQFPAALIDEFQDTDAVQYRIFDMIYAPHSNRQDQALVLIGDPKQAIYSFRGADIYTYLAAKTDTAGRHATLRTNFRSSHDMVEAVNHVFHRAEQRPDRRGAFLFGAQQGNPLPFLAVIAKGRNERWMVEGQPAPALTFWWSDDGAAISKDIYVTAMADACAAEVVHLLNLGQQGRAGFARDDVPLQAATPGDMAVLVNTGKEAAAVRKALAAVGVRSVYLSDKDSVYETPVAADVQRLLQACASPDDDRLLRAALGTALLGLALDGMERFNIDELHWEETVLQFRRYRDRWRRQGVLPMLRRLLNDFGVPHRLLAETDERTLTDVLHLAELLQLASPLLDGEHALVRYLAEQRGQQDAIGNESRVVRLESDADLLKVITVHKSKGLEFPLVFLPFPCSFRATKPADVPIKWHDAENQLHVSVQPTAQEVAAADEERLAEDLRKLYVGLTRARFATWLGVAPLNGLECSAMGSLLCGREPLGARSIESVLLSLRAGCASIAVQAAPARSDDRYTARRREVKLAPEPPLRQERPEKWWIASYSRLRKDEAADTEDLPAGSMSGPEPVMPSDTSDASLQEPESADEANYLEGADEAAAASSAAALASGGWLHGFPRGASPGSFLHGILEWAGRNGFGQTAANRSELQRVVGQRCKSRGWGAWSVSLADWLESWLKTPLKLSMLDPQARDVAPAALRNYQVEMEFWFSTARIDARRLDELVCRHTLAGAPRRKLQQQELNGMFKGFIDLVFEHQGRYYVVDYKSNALGRIDADYTAEAMRDEILHHRYELQYALYLFALHRHLRSRMPDYDYDRDVGGAVYVFLRGSASITQGLHVERPPRALMDAMDALFTEGSVHVGQVEHQA